MAGENEMKIIFGADTSPLRAEVAKGADVVEQFGDTVTKAADRASQGFDRVKKSTKGVPQAFDEVAAGAAALARINKSIDAAADAALKGGKAFDQFITRVPIDNLNKLDAGLSKLKSSLAFPSTVGGFLPTPVVFNKVADSVEKTSKAAGKLRTSSSAAAMALTDVTRIAQDMPFGLMGIQNNLTPLLDSFRRLKAETGSGKEAFKALATSLTGVGGLALAISVVASAFTIYQNGISGFNKKTKEAKDNFEDFKNSLKDASTISDEATGSIQDEVVKVQTLAKVTGDVTRSTQERTRALNDLQQINKSYFGDLTLETAALGRVTAATEEYTKALLAQAIAKGFADELSKVAVELRKQEGILTRLEGNYKSLGSVTKQNLDAATRFGAAYQDVQKISEKASAEESFLKQRDLVEDLRGEMVSLKGEYSNALIEGLKFKDLDTTTNTKKEVDAIKQRISALKELISAGVDVAQNEVELRGLEIKLIRRDGKSEGFTEKELEQLIFAKFGDFKGGIKLARPIEIGVPVTFKLLGGTTPGEAIDAADPAGDNIIQGIDRTVQRIEKAGQEAGKKLRSALTEPFEQLNNSFNAVVLNSFEGIADALGNLFSGGNPVEGFLSVISNALQDLGKAMIAFALAEKFAIDALFAGPQGWAIALGAGVAAIAAGKLLQSQLNKTRKFAEGGLVMGPTMGMVGESGPEMVIPLSRANQFLDGGDDNGYIARTELEGEKLLLLIERAAAGRRRRNGK